MPRFLRNKVYTRLFVSVLALMVFAGSELFAAEVPNTKPSPETRETELDSSLLQLADTNEWVSWDDIKDDPERINKIRAVQDSYRLALDPQFPREKWHLLFRAEIGDALIRGEEPVYLRSFSKQVRVYLRKFLKPHKEAFAGQNPAREARMRKELAMKVLLGMSAYHKVGLDTAQHAAKSAAWHAARVARYDPEKAASWAACQLGTSAWYAAEYAARSAARSAAEYGAEYGAEYAARSAAASVCNAACNAVIQENLGEPRLGMISSRVAEMAVNIYCLRNFDAILSSVFEALKRGGLLTEVEWSLFASSESWADFKGEHFSFHERPAAQHFLEPWLEEIDGLVLMPLAGDERVL